MVRKTLIALAVLLVAAPAAVAAPELAVSDRLKDRRYLASSERAYAVGFQDGRFYANGWHITGEMGGVWTPPLKLVDGVWFGVDDEWIGPATEFRSGWGYTEMDLPPTAGLRLRRTDYAPDGRRAVLFGLHVSNPGAARTVTVKVDAHSELLGAYPWGFEGANPNALDNLPDSAGFDGRALVFRERGTLPHPNAEPHDWAALVAADRRPHSGVTGATHRGDQGDNVCSAEEPPSQCDDGPFGRGRGGQLRYRLRIPAGGEETLWVAVAGSDEGLGAARAELAKALRDPERALERKVAARERLARFTELSLPGDRRLAEGIDWAKQNLADSTQYAEDLEIRWVDQGRRYPPPAGTVARARWVGAGFPDYPWIFATDGEYTAFPMVALGQFEAIEDHMRFLRDASDIVNDGSGKVGHEFVSDGSMWFGQNADPGNTDETAKFPSAVALIWRWTGDDRFRDKMYDFAERNMRYIVRELDDDGDGWPEGLGNVEREGMGPEKLDNTVYFIRGLYDLADMARSKHDGRTYAWARNLARRLHRRFEAAWWMEEQSLHADSLGGGNERIQQKHWITVTPMEAELAVKRRPVPGLTTFEHGTRSLALHETSCFSGERPFNRGLFHTGCGGGPEGQGELTIFGLNTAIQSVGEGNYGRLREQRRYTEAEVEPMFAEPATGGRPDEQPGALPEILPSPEFGKNIDRCWTCRAMFMQAWGHYGSAWPVVHQHLGVRPDLGRGELEVVPQLPSRAPIAGERIRLGDGALRLVRASRRGRRYRTKVHTGSAPVRRLLIGHTLPHGSRVRSVRLDGRRTGWRARETNRGLEVTAKTRPGEHVLVVRAR
ncbi:MAG: glycogen debranching protein [Thermoleophilaceae bacterium]